MPVQCCQWLHVNHHFLYFTGAVFPMANALQYYDVGLYNPSLVQCRNGIFLELGGNWGKGRKYVVISSGTIRIYILKIKNNINNRYFFPVAPPLHASTVVPLTRGHLFCWQFWRTNLSFIIEMNLRWGDTFNVGTLLWVSPCRRDHCTYVLCNRRRKNYFWCQSENQKGHWRTFSKKKACASHQCTAKYHTWHNRWRLNVQDPFWFWRKSDIQNFSLWPFEQKCQQKSIDLKWDVYALLQASCFLFALVNFSQELPHLVTKYDFLRTREVILSNVWTDFNLTQFYFWSNFQILLIKTFPRVIFDGKKVKFGPLWSILANIWFIYVIYFSFSYKNIKLWNSIEREAATKNVILRSNKTFTWSKAKIRV